MRPILSTPSRGLRLALALAATLYSASTLQAQTVHDVPLGADIQSYIDDNMPDPDTGVVFDLPGVDVQDGDVLQLAIGDYDVAETIDLRGRALTLRGWFEPGFIKTKIVTSAVHAVQCVNGEGPDTVLQFLDIQGGNASNPAGAVSDQYGGGLLIKGASPRVLTCAFSKNIALRGGAVYIDGGDPSFEYCSFSNNNAVYMGGAICAFDSDFQVTYCIVVGNSATFGGAVYVGRCSEDESFPVCDGTSSAPIIAATEFLNNMLPQFDPGIDWPWPFGGGWDTFWDWAEFTYSWYSVDVPSLIFGMPGIPMVPGSDFAPSQGGAIFASDVDLTLLSCEFHVNRAYRGGAIYGNGSVIDASACVFGFNTHYGLGIEPNDTMGGTVLSYASDMTFDDCTFAGGNAYVGAAIAVYDAVNDPALFADYVSGPHGDGSASLTVSRSEFTNGIASIGGAIASFEADLTLTDCAFASNQATDSHWIPTNKFFKAIPVVDDYYGGAVYSEGGEVSIARCEFNANIANRGGALHIVPSPSLVDASVDRCKFVGNSANTGGAIFSGAGTTQITNGLFRDNFALGRIGGQFGSDPDAIEHGVIQNTSLDGGVVAVTNCTIAYNAGGGYSWSSGPDPNGSYDDQVWPRVRGIYLGAGGTVHNTIVWGNESNQYGTQQVEGSPSMGIQASLVQGGVPGYQVSTSTPNFVDPPELLWLESGPGVDQGSNALLVPGADASDLNGNGRVLNPGFNGDCAVSPGLCGATPPATVDMGAYELGSDGSSCPVVEPLVAGAVHSCQDHSSHNHAGESLAGINLSWADLDDSDFSGCDLSGAILTDVTLRGENADLSGANLAGADLRRGQFHGCDFSGANVEGADFRGARFLDALEWTDFNCGCGKPAKGLEFTVGAAIYDATTNFAGTGFDPIAAGWTGFGLPTAPLIGSPEIMNVQTGGSVQYYLDAGDDFAGHFYALFGSFGDGSPGLPVGNFLLPLNFDIWFSTSIDLHNTAYMPNTWGFLDEDGRAVAGLVFPPSFQPILNVFGPDSELYHAYVTIDVVAGGTSSASPAVRTQMSWQSQN